MINLSIGLLPIVVIVLIMAWFLTKSWVKVGYILSAFLFIMAFFSAMGSSGKQVLDYLKNVLAMLSLGFLVLSLTLLMNTKKK